MAGIPQYLVDMFAQYGLSDLGTWYLGRVQAGATEAQIAEELYDQPAYQARFPAMAALRTKGRAMTEAQYMAVEKSYRDSLAAYGLRASVYDNPTTFAGLMESEVSTRELEERLQDAKMVVDAADPNVRKVLLETYGIGGTDLLAYALDPKGQGKDHVEKLARSATLQGLARTMSLNMSQQYAENLAMDTAFDNRTEADYRDALSNVSELTTAQSRLASIEGQAFTAEDAADVVVKKDARKTLASRERAAREAARFSGSSGLSGATLRGSGI